jgi:hypothetical protein
VHPPAAKRHRAARGDGASWRSRRRCSDAVDDQRNAGGRALRRFARYDFQIGGEARPRGKQDPLRHAAAERSDLLWCAVKALKLANPKWQREEDNLLRDYGIAHPLTSAQRAAIDKALAVLAITDFDTFAAMKADLLRSAKAKQKTQETQKTQKTQPAGRIIRKTFHRAQIPPLPGESRDEFLSRCIEDATAEGIDEDDAEQQCEISWGRWHARAAQKAAKDGGIWFTLSDENPDRMNDIVLQNWDLSQFKKNPVCLFAHDSSLPPCRSLA